MSSLAQVQDDRFLPVTSFGNEPLWLTVGKAVFVFWPAWPNNRVGFIE